MANDRNQHAESLDPLVILRQRNMTIVDQYKSAYVLLMEGASLTDEEKNHPAAYLLGVIGKGGQGVVLKAWDCAEKKQVCIKMAKYKSKDKDTVARSDEAFRREAEFYRKVGSHANIASLLFSGRDGGAEGSPCLVIERCYGSPLAKLISHYQGKRRSVPFNVRCKIMKDAASAVQHCSSSRIAHCDLTPSNFVWFPSMKQPVKLIDFGFAVDLDEDSHFKGGTFGYKAPEHIRRERPQKKSDVFGLGCLFYKLHNISPLPWDRAGHTTSWNYFQTMYESVLEDNLRKDCKDEQERQLLLNMLKIKHDERPDWSEILKHIAGITTDEQKLDMGEASIEALGHSGIEPRSAHGTQPASTPTMENPQEANGEQKQDMGEPSKKVMRLPGLEPKPARGTQPESTPITKSAEEADDEGTASEESRSDEENCFTREHYSNTLAAVERNDQSQRRIIEEGVLMLENGTEFDSKQMKTINRVRKDIKKRVNEARQRIESAGGRDDIRQVAKKIAADVTDIGDKGKSDVDKNAKEETDKLKNKVSALVKEAGEEIFDMAITSPMPNV